MTPTEIEPANFRLVAQCLNQRHCVTGRGTITNSGIETGRGSAERRNFSTKAEWTHSLTLKYEVKNL